MAFAGTLLRSLPILACLWPSALWASEVKEVYSESFFCGCQPGALGAGRASCPFFPNVSFEGPSYNWLRLMPLDTAGAAGVCSGEMAPAECDTAALEEALRIDLYNWLPVTADVHQMLQGRTFIDIATELRPSSCDLELSDEVAAVEPPDHLKGDIARRMLYLVGRYNISLPDQYLQMLINWDANDPVSGTEYRISRKLGELQNSDNAFVTVRYERAQKKMKAAIPEALR